MTTGVRSTWPAYVSLFCGSVGALVLLREVARRVLREEPSALSPKPLAIASSDVLAHLLLALLVLLALSRALAFVLRPFGQPGVIGDILAGILLGPSVLGQLAPDWAAFLVPAQITPLLSGLAHLGVLVFMFLVGLELDPLALRRRGHTALIISHAGIALPFVLGAAFALCSFDRLAPPGVRFEVFALFLGAAMSITAFPVLARILRDRGLQRAPLGVLALSCAAIDDVTAWCALAAVVGLANAAPLQGLSTLAYAVQFLLLAYLVLRPLLHWFARQQEARPEISQAAVAVGLGVMFVSALATELIGIHAIFGAFLAGALIPHDTRWAHALREKLEDVVLVLLLPAFFAHTGLRTQLGLLSSAQDWLLCAAVVLVACLGKLGGTYFAARYVGLSRSDACALGALMNTRGMMELIVLNIGLDLGIIGPSLFAMMVVMALLTTLLAGPVLNTLKLG
jgi:Kef-type K+ transport system membrane component KefB